jgi:Ser-tRNA(Ala) deacylase AlaX
VTKVDASYEDVRLVTVRDGPTIPCDGTHVARTGEVGEVRLTGLTPSESGDRLTFEVL